MLSKIGSLHNVLKCVAKDIQYNFIKNKTITLTCLTSWHETTGTVLFEQTVVNNLHIIWQCPIFKNIFYLLICLQHTFLAHQSSTIMCKTVHGRRTVHIFLEVRIVLAYGMHPFPLPNSCTNPEQEWLWNGNRWLTLNRCNTPGSPAFPYWHYINVKSVILPRFVMNKYSQS